MKDFLISILNEWLFIASSLGLAVSSLILKKLPAYTFNDFKVIFVIYVFLVIVRGLEKHGFLYGVSQKLSNEKMLAQKLILLTGLLSMFITNDVSLFIVVPLTLSLNIKNKDILIILETLIANSASSLTPFGNPQNIFIYYFYNLHPWEFIKSIAPFSLILSTIIILMSFKFDFCAKDCKKESSIQFNQKSFFYLFFFVIFILSILKIFPLYLGFIPLFYALLFDRESLIIDYFLPATFFVFFGFTDNLMRIIKVSLDSPKEVFFYSSLSSQVISNVPGTLLFADFTRDWKSLLWGVSVGGFGSIISSLANLIAFRLYKVKYKDHHFILKFHIFSFSLFAIGIFLFFIFGI